MTLGQHIQELRKRAGLSQEILGERLNVSRQAVSKWESDVTVPEVDTLIAMSRLFGVTVGELLQVEAPADPPNVELTERELSAVEAIVRRYVEETESRRAASEAKPTAPARRRLLLLAAAALLVLFAGSALLNRLERMTEQVNNLRNQLNSLNSSVSGQIGSITDQVTELLEEQNSLTVDCGASLTQFDLKEGTVLFDLWAVPKTWQEGMTVTFHVTCDSGVFSVPGTDNGAHRFSASLSFPLTDETVLIDANFTAEGVTRTQRLYEDNHLLSSTFPWVEFPSYGFHALYHESLPEGGELTFREDEIFVDGFLCEPTAQFGPAPSLFTDGFPTVQSLEVGLFLNRTLVTRLVPKELFSSVVLSDHRSWDRTFCLPALSLRLEEGDELTLAARITDNYGRTLLVHIDGVVAEGDPLTAIPFSTKERTLDPAEWEF